MSTNSTTRASVLLPATYIYSATSLFAFSTPLFYTFRMEVGKHEKGWERTNVTNLLRNRQSGNYYARVKVNGKQKWRSLETTVFSVAKLRVADAEKEIRSQGIASKAEVESGNGDETHVGRFATIYRQRTADNASLSAGTKLRRDIAVKAILKTWPELADRDVRRLTPTDCRTWAAKAFREGTGFIAPKVKTVRKGMSPSAFNKCVDTLRSILEIARELGVIYKNPATEIAKARIRQKRLELPSAKQFQEIVKHIATAGARWSLDCADMVRFLTYSGARLREATALRWSHVNPVKNEITIPGTKSGSSYRIVPLFPGLVALLTEIKSRRGPEAQIAPIIRVGGCLGALESACKAVGLKPINHHDLRHLFATRCIESGVDIPTVSRWLGHSDGGALAMKTYGHLRQEHSAAQAAKVSF
ncbi:MAG: site-specific integrase [Opitutaceae bacterium]